MLNEIEKLAKLLTAKAGATGHTSKRSAEDSRGSVPDRVLPTNPGEPARRPTSVSFQHPSKNREKWEAVLKNLHDIIRFKGCTCNLDKKAQECRLESAESGRWISKIASVNTCVQDCRNFYFDPRRPACASEAFLAKKREEFQMAKEEHAIAVGEEQGAFNDAKKEGLEVQKPSKPTFWQMPK